MLAACGPADAGPATPADAAATSPETAPAASQDGLASRRAAHEANPTDPEPRFAYANALRWAGQDSEARELLAADPTLRWAAAWQEVLRDNPAALVRAIDPNDPDPSLLAMRLWAMHRTGEDPGWVDQVREHLYDLYGEGELTQAQDLWAVAIAAWTRGTTGALKDANQVLNEAEDVLSDAPSWVTDAVLLTRARLFADRYAADEAIATLELLLHRRPDDPDALALAAKVQLDALNLQAATKLATKAMARAPAVLEARTVLARIALLEGRRGDTERLLDTKYAPRPGPHTGWSATEAALALATADTERFKAIDARWAEARASDPGFAIELADMLAVLHLYRQADAALTPARARMPREPRLDAAWAINRLRLGDEEHGVQALTAAWTSDRFNARVRNLLELFEKKIALDYTTLQFGDLSLRLPKEDAELLGPPLAETVSGIRAELDRRYGQTPSPLTIEIYRDSQAFSVRTVGVPDLGALAVCFGPVITMRGPYQGHVDFEQVLWHELGHVYAIERTEGRVPRWFTEGLSEWETQVTDASWGVRAVDPLIGTALPQLEELEFAFLRANSAADMERAYTLATYAVRHLANEYGRPALLGLLDRFRVGEDVRTALPGATGKNLQHLNAVFHRWLQAEVAATTSGFRHDPTRPDEPEQIAYAQARAAAKAERWADAGRVVGKLIAGGHDGYGPQMVAGRAAAKAGKPTEAIAHFERAAELHKQRPDPLLELARIAWEQGHADREIAALVEALRRDTSLLPAAVRLLALSTVLDAPERDLALRRARAVAPLHPAALLATAADAPRGSRHARELYAAGVRALGSHPPPELRAIAWFAARHLGIRADVKRWRENWGDKLPPPKSD